MTRTRQTKDDAGDTAMTRTYVRVIALEVVIIVALWVFGRMFI